MKNQVSLTERILYEDNHLIIVNKVPGEIVQEDCTGDRTLGDDIKEYLRVKYNKPGNVFLGVPHRLDRPTSGIVVFARTGKALERLSKMFREGDVTKYYWAICDRNPGDVKGRLEHYIVRNSEKNKSFAYSCEKPGSKKAVLEYEQLAVSDRYTLLQIHLLTGRHHQIRSQLAACNVHIKGDLKYGFPRSDENGGICLHSRKIIFTHPVSGQEINITAPVPQDRLWAFFEAAAN